MRDLCVQLDQTKDSLTRQLALVSVTQEQNQHEMNDTLAERDLLKQQVLVVLYKMEPLTDVLCI